MNIDSERTSRLSKYLRNDKVKVSESDLEMLSKYERVFSIWVEKKSKLVTARTISNLFGVSMNHAYNLMLNAELLFGNITETSKQMKRHIASEMALDTYRIALATKNLEQMNKAIANYTKANSLHIDDPDLPDFTKLTPPQTPVIIDVEFLEKYADKIDAKILETVKNELAKLKIFFFQDKNIVNVEYQDLNENDEAIPLQ